MVLNTIKSLVMSISFIFDYLKGNQRLVQLYIFFFFVRETLEVFTFSSMITLHAKKFTQEMTSWPHFH